MTRVAASAMRAWTVVTAITLAPLCAAAVTPVSSTTENEIRNLEAQDRDALLRGDAAALARIWGNNLVVNAPSDNIRTGAELLELVRTGKTKYSSFHREVQRVSVQGEIAIAMGTESVVPATGPQTGKTVQRRFSNVWARQNGQWRLIARQATIVQP